MIVVGYSADRHGSAALDHGIAEAKVRDTNLLVINATTGVLEINKIYLDVGRNFKASRWNTFWTIALPGALPVIMTGFKLGIGIGLVLIAVAERVGAKSGLGYLIWSAWSTFAVEQMYVGLFVIAIIGFLITLGLNELERVIIPWKTE